MCCHVNTVIINEGNTFHCTASLVLVLHSDLRKKMFEIVLFCLKFFGFSFKFFKYKQVNDLHRVFVK